MIMGILIANLVFILAKIALLKLLVLHVLTQQTENWIVLVILGILMIILNVNLVVINVEAVKLILIAVNLVHILQEILVLVVIVNLHFTKIAVVG